MLKREIKQGSMTIGPARSEDDLHRVIPHMMDIFEPRWRKGGRETKCGRRLF